MTGNSGWASSWAVEKAFIPTPAPKRGDKRGEAFDKGAEIRKANVAALVEKLKQKPPQQH